jgi:hypothetical protein
MLIRPFTHALAYVGAYSRRHYHATHATFFHELR